MSKDRKDDAKVGSNSDILVRLDSLWDRCVPGEESVDELGRENQETGDGQRKFSQADSDLGILRKRLEARVREQEGRLGEPVGETESERRFFGEYKRKADEAAPSLLRTVCDSGPARQDGSSEEQERGTGGQVERADREGTGEGPELPDGVREEEWDDISQVISLLEERTPIVAQKLKRKRETAKQRGRFADFLTDLLSDLG